MGVRPKDSDIFHGQRNYVTLRSSANEDYQSKKGEAVQVKRPPTSEIWKVNYCSLKQNW